jgi:ankyrin repeat protein
MGAGCCGSSKANTQVVPYEAKESSGVVPADVGTNGQVTANDAAASCKQMEKPDAALETSGANNATSMSTGQGGSGSSCPVPAAKKKPKTLIKAVKDNDVQAVEELLSGGCDTEVLGMWDNTPLIVACSYGHAEVALRLIERKAKVHARNEHGGCALHYAAIEGQLTVVEALLEAARAEGKNDDAVKEFVNCEAAKLYNRHLDVYSVRTPVAAAAESGFAAVVSKLLKEGASVDAAGDDQRTPLWLACRQSHTEVARRLLKAGANASAKASDGMSLLEAATIGCKEELVRTLLNHGVGDVNSTSGSPLRNAVKTESQGTVEALLTHGAIVNPKGEDGVAYTPLHAACELGDEYIVGLLMKHGADPSIKDKAGLTAFDLLRKRHFSDAQIVALLSPTENRESTGATGDTMELN